MDANEVKNLKWMLVTDWSKLSKTYRGFLGDLYVGESDVDCFVENVFKDVARRLNIAYSELEPILKEENSAFYSEKARLFGRYTSVTGYHMGLLKLEGMLRIPDVLAFFEDISKSSVDKVLYFFSALTDMEKLEVLQRLGQVSVKVEFFAK